MDQSLREQITKIVQQEVTKVLVGTNQGSYNEKHFIQRIVDAVLFTESQLEAEVKFAMKQRLDDENWRLKVDLSQKTMFLEEAQARLDIIRKAGDWEEKGFECYECGRGQDE